jgi:hypothetical protein
MDSHFTFDKKVCGSNGLAAVKIADKNGFFTYINSFLSVPS